MAARKARRTRRTARAAKPAAMPAQMHARKWPGFAFLFVLIGGMLALLGSVILPMVGVQTALPGTWWLAVVATFMILISALEIRSHHRMRKRGWSIVAFVFSMLGFLTISGFNYLSMGFVLVFIGSIMGIVHH